MRDQCSLSIGFCVSSTFLFFEKKKKKNVFIFLGFFHSSLFYNSGRRVAVSHNEKKATGRDVKMGTTFFNYVLLEAVRSETECSKKKKKKKKKRNDHYFLFSSHRNASDGLTPSSSRHASYVQNPIATPGATL